MNTIAGLAETFGKLNATHVSSEHAIAEAILSGLVGYKPGIHWAGDREFLTVALQAYAKLLQDHGVKVEA